MSEMRWVKGEFQLKREFKCGNDATFRLTDLSIEEMDNQRRMGSSTATVEDWPFVCPILVNDEKAGKVKKLSSCI